MQRDILFKSLNYFYLCGANLIYGTDKYYQKILSGRD